jgi:pimeloyl-ACP methyl ester carboxylesterase
VSGMQAHDMFGGIDAAQGVSRRSLLLAGVAAMAIGSFARDAAAQANAAISRFVYHAPQSALDDLKRRLLQTRWPERETVGDWSQGVPLDKLQALVAYWRDDYDWRRCEAMLNGFGQFRTEIDGLNFHFLHVRSPHENALPLLITHGWPGSVLEFHKIIAPLTDPTRYGGRAEDAFHVIAPSLPGFGFSDKPTERGWNDKRTARAWAELMRRLGYARYVAQGGDWGSFVTTRLAQMRPPGLIGIHLNFPLVLPDPTPMSKVTAEEEQALARVRILMDAGPGLHIRVHSLRPQLIGYALADSPVAQAAWIYQIFNDATGGTGDPESMLTRDEMLDDITLYWLTDSGASSARFYAENANAPLNPGRVEIPVGYSSFPNEFYRPPRAWADRVYPNIIHWGVLDRGGHFAALEQPALFVNELRTCFRSLR